MYKPQVLSIFPKEIQDLAVRGVYTLFEAKDGKGLLAKTDKDLYFVFDNKGNYGAIFASGSVDLSKYDQLDTTDGEQIIKILQNSN